MLFINKKIDMFIYAILACLILTNIIIISQVNIKFPWSCCKEVLYGIGFLIGIIIFFKNYTKNFTENSDRAIFLHRTIHIFKRLIELILISFNGAIFSYLVATFNFPLYDDMFDMWDKSLGFDWIYWFIVFKKNDWLLYILFFAYQSIPLQMLLLLLLLGYKQPYNLQIFIFLFLSTAIIAIVVSGVLPSFGVYHYYQITPDMLKNMPIVAPYNHIDHLEHLRARTLMIFPDMPQGIITFPSFHASLAVIFILVSRNLQYLKWFFFVLNILMIISTPINGGHYFVDVIAGMIIAIAMFQITKLSYLMPPQTIN